MDFSDAEKKRIGESLLDKKSLPYYVLNSKFNAINDNDFWRSAQRQYDVNGFRNGHPTAKTMVVQRALGRLKNSDPINSDIWPLYRQCVIMFVIQDMKELNSLLLREDFEETSDPQTEQIFKFICAKMFSYGVAFEDIEKLYDLWGFERIEHFERIFTELQINPEQIRQLVSLEAQKTKTELAALISDLQSELISLREKNILTDSQLTERCDQIQTELESNFSEIREQLDEIDISDFKEELNNLRNAVLTQGSNTKEQKIVSVLDEKNVRRLDEKIEKLEKLVEQQKKEAELLIQDRKSDPRAIKEEPIVVDRDLLLGDWKKNWELKGIKGVTPGIQWIFLQLIRRSKIMILNQPSLLADFLKSIPGTEYKSIVASPTWISNQDWQESFDFISSSSSRLRILNICDFDCGIQESYLVPSLVSFARTHETSLNRIILTPSKSDLSSICNRILELGIYLDFGQAWLEDYLGRPSSFDTRAVSISQKSSLGDFLGYVEATNYGFEKELNTVFDNSDVQLPPLLSKQFLNIYSGFEVSGSGDAWKISSQVSLLPWVQCTLGTSQKRIVEETLKTFMGVN